MKKYFHKFSKATLVASLVGLILLLDAMAACPALHELIHKDAEHADHHCAVTMFAHGKVDSVTCEVPTVAPTVWLETTPSINLFVFSATIENLPLGRAPPSVASLLV